MKSIHNKLSTIFSLAAVFTLFTVASYAQERIAFQSNRDGNIEVYVMNTDGSDQTRLTYSSADDFNPEFSPDGSRIAFSTSRDGNAEIYVMNADGTHQTRL